MGYRIPPPPLIREEGLELMATSMVWESNEIITAADMNTCLDIEELYQEDWFCQYCTQENDADHHHCYYCGGNKPQ